MLLLHGTKWVCYPLWRDKKASVLHSFSQSLGVNAPLTVRRYLRYIFLLASSERLPPLYRVPVFDLSLDAPLQLT